MDGTENRSDRQSITLEYQAAVLEIAYKVLDLLTGALFGARRLRVRVHIARFLPSDDMAVFVKVVNLSTSRDVEITHVWIASEPNVQILNVDRPLPVRIKPDETWETWFPLRDTPAALIDKLFRLVRVQLSSGAIFKSKENKAVPEFGHVAGGAVSASAEQPVTAASARTLAIVRNIYGPKSGWAPAREAGRAMVVAPYLITNVSNKPILVTKVEAQFGNQREAAGLAQSKVYIEPDETLPLVAIFFADRMNLKRGADFVADIGFVDQFGNEHVLHGERFRSVASLP